MDVIDLWNYLRELGEAHPNEGDLPQPGDDEEVFAVALAGYRDSGSHADEFGGEHPPIWIGPDDLPILPEGLRPGEPVAKWNEDRPAPRGEWESSIHACAWYRQVTFSGPGFGIFVRQDCMLEIAEEMALFVPGTILDLGKIDFLVRLAFNFLYLHEQFHHKVESLAIRLAVAERRAVYGPYWRNAYSPSRGTNALLEEALANADAFHRFAEERYARRGAPSGRDPVAGARHYLRAQFNSAPPGYDQAVNYLTWREFQAGQQELAAIVFEGIRPAPADWDRWQFATHMLRGLFPITSSIWVVIATGSRPLVPTTAPPLSVSTKEVIRLLPKLQYQRVPGQGKGSREKWAPKSGHGNTVEIPLDQDIPKGTLNRIAKDLGFVNGHQLALACRNRSHVRL